MEDLLREQLVVSTSRHPHLRGSLNAALGRGQVVRVLPGTYVASGAAGVTEVLARAATGYEPDAVVVGRAALSLLTGETSTAPPLVVACPQRHAGSPSIRFTSTTVPPEWVVERDGLHIQHPAAAAVELAATDGGQAIDLVLRLRLARLAHLRRALRARPGRAGNGARAHVILESRDEPWSTAERLLHRLLREAGLEGWHTNYPIRLREGIAYADVAFPAARWIVEADGFGTHGTREALMADLRRQNELILAGWRVLRFTWSDLIDRPGCVISQVRKALGVAAE